MIYELRTYQLAVGGLPEYLEVARTKILPGVAEYGLKPVGFWYTEVGPLNEVVHLWAYESLDQRDKCRAQMQADPAWQAYLVKNRPLMISQETRVMKCAPFFVERLKKMLAAVEKK